MYIMVVIMPYSIAGAKLQQLYFIVKLLRGKISNIGLIGDPGTHGKKLHTASSYDIDLLLAVTHAVIEDRLKVLR